MEVPTLGPRILSGARWESQSESMNSSRLQHEKANRRLRVARWRKAQDVFPLGGYFERI